MHKIKCKKSGGEKGKLGSFEQAFAESVHDGYHCNTEYCAHTPPAKRVHSENAYADCNDLLSERRMCPFVDGHAVKSLVCSSCMIQLIKIHARHRGAILRSGILLINQSIPCFIFCMNGYSISVSIKKRKFIKNNASLCDAQRNGLYFFCPEREFT